MGQPLTMDAPALLQRCGLAVSEYFEQVLARATETPPRLREAIRYSLLAGGKRLRPTLVLETFGACGGGEARSALAAAGAIELIHTFSLVHDDLPAMDDDDLRRGRPTNHKVFGEAMAILAGDAMVTMAFELLATDARVNLVPALVRELAWASGPEGMIGGQVLDMESEGRRLELEPLQALHRKKTGALLTCACRMGAICAGAGDDVLESVTVFGKRLGLAFQIVDDLLDVTSSAEQMGKATGKDAKKGKNTYPSLMGLERAQAEAQVQLREGLAAIERLGPRAASLRTLAEFVVKRDR